MRDAAIISKLHLLEHASAISSDYLNEKCVFACLIPYNAFIFAQTKTEMEHLNHIEHVSFALCL